MGPIEQRVRDLIEERIQEIDSRTQKVERAIEVASEAFASIARALGSHPVEDPAPSLSRCAACDSLRPPGDEWVWIDPNDHTRWPICRECGEAAAAEAGGSAIREAIEAAALGQYRRQKATPNNAN